jgi:serine/threonine protein kinase
MRARFLAPGTRIGRYTIVRRLASGGMAELYLARVEGLRGFEKLVALKLVLPHLADDPEFVSMFLDEARLAATLDHPNVVHVIDVGRFGRDHFFAMEYVHGEDLRSVVRRAEAQGGVPLGCALAIVSGVAAGLHHAHERRGPDGLTLGLVHRDVSPSNVIVTYDGAVKVVDFGIARVGAQSKATRLGVVKGKAGYMSPEQCRGEPVDRRSDVFGLGILLWELTLGRRLFSGEHDYAAMSKIVFGLVPHPREVLADYPEALADVVMRALQRDADKRQPSALAFALELEAFAHAAHLRVTTSALAEYMTTLFGLPPYPSLAELGEPQTTTQADEDEATRIDPHAPPRPVVKKSAVSALVLAGSAALAIGGVGFGLWAWLGRTPVAEAPTASPSGSPAAVDARAAEGDAPASAAVPELPSDEDAELVVVEDEPARASGADARESSRRKRSQKTSRDRDRGEPAPRALPVSDPAPRRGKPERPNDLFPPSD